MWKSIKNNRTGMLMMGASSACVCLGQLFWKLSANSGILYLFLGFALYGLGALLMLFAYGHGKLSILQPMLSLNYVFTIIIGYFVLDEVVDIFKIIGVITIIIGVILIGGSDDD